MSNKRKGVLVVIPAADVKVGMYLYFAKDNGLGHIHRVTDISYRRSDYDGSSKLVPRKDKSRDAELGPEIVFESHNRRVCIPVTLTERMDLCSTEEIEEFNKEKK